MRLLLLCALLLAQDPAPKTVPEDAGSAEAPLLLGIGIHVEPFGSRPSALVPEAKWPPGNGRQPDYNEKGFFRRHLADLREVVKIVEAHGGKLTVQAQTPFTKVAADSGEAIFADLEKAGHEVALHFHEDAHLGRECERIAAEKWTAVMREEIDWLRKAGATRIRYWSGGNLYEHLLVAAAGAGLDVMGDYKNPKIQKSDERLLTVFPWRPSAGPTDLEKFSKHDPAGKIVYVPSGAFAKADYAASRRSKDAGGDAKYFDFLTESLEKSLRAARKDRVNTYHITIHPGEFRGDRARPFGVIEDWLAKVVDPLVRAGKVKWATYSQMADAFVAWERANAGVDPRSASAPAQEKPKGTMTFAVNTHDWVHPEASADTILRLIAIFEKHKVRGDFYLTAPVVEAWAAKKPEVIERLKASGMTISYHVRAPHPLWSGFDARLQNLGDAELEQALRDYETYRLDLATGDLDRTRPGGYAYVAKTFGTNPVVVGAPNKDRRIARTALKVYREMGARMTILYHESGTKVDQPFEFHEGLLVRPSDFSITRWKLDGETEDQFWWNRRDGDPVGRLKGELAAWKAPRAPYVTALIHENNFYRFGPEGWTAIYWSDRRKTQPKLPPYDLTIPDRSRERGAEERDRIFAQYEGMVAYAAENLTVATSADLVAAAK